MSDAIKLQAAGQKRTSSVYPRPRGGYLVFLWGGSGYRLRTTKFYDTYDNLERAGYTIYAYEMTDKGWTEF